MARFRELGELWVQWSASMDGGCGVEWRAIAVSGHEQRSCADVCGRMASVGDGAWEAGNR